MELLRIADPEYLSLFLLFTLTFGCLAAIDNLTDKVLTISNMILQIQGDCPSQDNVERKLPKNRVKVAIRVRPMIAREVAAQEASCVQTHSKTQIVIGQDRSYKFDRVFDKSSTQKDVYRHCVRDLIMGCFEGYNAAVLAYGQTGSGKTYTMGTNSLSLDNDEQGLIPQVIAQIFSEVQKRQGEAEFVIKTSFLEIYNEQMIDLLDEKALKNNNISIREEKDGSVSIHGATEELVSNAEEMLSQLEKGSLQRTTASTMMNQSSSRSHAIFTIFIQQRQRKTESPFEEGFITAKFFFVDLAGSQRAKKTGATGLTMKEGININLGLLQLGNVISALALQRKQANFITFRNSKLTRILQDSLGGNSNTYMIACISPAESNYEESLNTLKYASKAMNIKNKPVINRDPHSALLLQLRMKIAQLECDNTKLIELLGNNGISFQSQPMMSSLQSKQQQRSDDQNSTELKALRTRFALLQRRNEIICVQLKDQKKRKNQLEIANYELKRESDLLRITFEDIRNSHPNLVNELPSELSKQQLPLIEDYLMRIRDLQSEMQEKEKINSQMQIQYVRLHELLQRDEKILLKKNDMLREMGREIKELKKELYEQRTGRQEQTGGEFEQIDAEYQSDNLVSEVEDSQYKSEQNNQQSMLNELSMMEKEIVQKQLFLRQVTNEQIELEYTLIEEMKEEYHQKIHLLEAERTQLMKNLKQEVNSASMLKYSSKIDSLEVELRQYRKKAKEQQNLEKKVHQQNNTIKSLANEIKNFKLQKIELGRKIKEDKLNFQRFRTKRSEELMQSKKENIRKDVEIRKLANDNKKKGLQALKKADEILRVRKANETLKKLMKSNKSKKDHNENMLQDNAQINQAVDESLKNILLRIDRDFDLEKYAKKHEEIDKELSMLYKEESSLGLKLERMKLKEEDSQFYSKGHDNREETQLQLNYNDVKQRIANLEDNREFCRRKHEQILLDCQQKYSYDVENEVIFKKEFNSINCLRGLLACLYKAMEKVLKDNYQIRMLEEEQAVKICSLQGEIDEAKENLLRVTAEHQQSLSRVREDMAVRLYESMIEDDNEHPQHKASLPEKVWAREKKTFERKIFDLTKINCKLSSDVQVWRRKCIIVQEKYQSMRSLFNKDKFIGRPSREEEFNTVISASKDLKYLLANPSLSPFVRNTLTPVRQTGNPNPIRGNLASNTSMIDEVNVMLEQLKSGSRVKRSLNYEEEAYNDTDKCEENVKAEFSRHKWECVTTIDAHSSPILSLAVYENFLISAATRNIRVWDLETNKIQSDITGPSLNSFVKATVVHREKHLMATACDKNVTLWDLRTLNTEGVLKGHRDDIKCMHIVGDLLFSAGKGISNCGSLLVWDLRYFNVNCPMQEKERNQDIFSMTSLNGIMYYGTRDHHVRRLNVQTMQTLPTFQPPHMDTVTALTTSKGYLISGSKDKNLRLWSLDNSIYNLKSTVHAFNDYITTVQNDNMLPIFYSGDRTGQVKVGTVYRERIEFVGIFGHTQSVNSICSLNRMVASGSSDKTIKLWQTTNETTHHLRAKFS